ncbi:MAG: hypothetical protein KBS91_02250 [Firmicutes bacterium]|nr:hypothetical protein [Candidatus Caballimonas caccae]
MVKTFSKKITAIIVLLAMLIVSVFIGVSYSWLFVGSNEVNLQLDSGSFILQYFHTGDGTKNNPFVITRPIHYYHMVELYQRRPDFAKGNLEDKDIGQPYYFQIGYNLDNSKDGSLEVFNYDDTGAVISANQYSKTLNMAYYSGSLALLPMGTSAVPFIGALDGKGMTIKNLHITATETVGETTYATSDIGVFGYIGGEYKKDSNGDLILFDDSGNQVTVDKIKKDANGSMIIENGKYVIETGGYAHPTYEGGFVHDVYYDNVTIDIAGLTSATQYDANGSVHQALTHMSHVNNEVYIGYLVGHLPVIYLDENGYNADSIFSNAYINDCDIIGGETDTLGVVQYGYIGHLDLLQYPDIQPATIEMMIQQMPSSGSGGTSGGTEGGGVLPGWGGSLDMRSLYEKLSTRIGGALGNALIGYLNPAKYITQETIYQEVTKDTEGHITKIEVTDHVTGRTSNETTKPRRFTVYDDGKYGYEGTLYVYNEWNGNWICLSRSSELHTKEVTYYTVTKGANEPAITLDYNDGANDNYLGRDTGGTAIKNTDKVNASNLTWDKDANGNFAQGQDSNGNYQGYLYTHNNGENAQYYLDTDGFNLNFVVSTQTGATHTVWHFEYDNDEKSIYTTAGKNHRIFTIIDGVKFYIVYGDSIFGSGCGWTVVPEKFEEIKIDDKFINYREDRFYLESESTTKWMLCNGKLFTKGNLNSNFTNVFLTNSNFALTVTNSLSTALSWGKDSSFFATIGGSNYNLMQGSIFTKTAYAFVPTGASIITVHDGDSYKTLDGINIIKGNSTNATNFIKNGTTVYTLIDGVANYLNATATSLSVSTTNNNTVWNSDGTSFYATIGGVRFNLIEGSRYFTYNVGITSNPFVLVSNIFTIHDGDVYIKLNGTNIEKGNSTNATNFTKNGNTVYTYINGVVNYLNATATSLSISTTSNNTVWNSDSKSFYATISNTRYNLIDGSKFFTNTTGFMMLKDGLTFTKIKEVKEGANYCLTVDGSSNLSATATGTNFIMETDANAGDYYPKFYTYIGNAKKYLNATTTAISFGDSATGTWIYEKAYNTLYVTTGNNGKEITPSSTQSYLHYNGSSWVMTSLSLSYDKFRIYSNNSNYRYFRDGASNQKVTNNVWEAKYWTLANEALYCEDNNGNRYLKGNAGFGNQRVDVQDTSSGATNWSLRDGNKIYWSGNSGKYLRWYGAASGWKTGNDAGESCIAIGRPNPASAMSLVAGDTVTYTNTMDKTGITYGNMNNVSYSVFSLTDKTFSPYYETQEEPQYETVEEEAVLVIDPNRYNANEVLSLVTDGDGNITKVNVAHFYVTLFDGYLGNYEVKKETGVDSTNYTYLPLTTKTDLDEDKNYNQYEASYFNTGYLISGSHSSSILTGVDVSRSDVRVSSYGLTNISNSLTTEQDAQGNNRNFTTNPFNATDDARLEILTITQDGTTYRIKDAVTPKSSHNSTNAYPSTAISGYQIKGVEELGLLGYQDLWGYYETGSTELKYSNFARDNLYTMMEGDSNAYGLHFMDATLDMNHLMTAEYVRILGHDYQTYQFPESCIDFRVENSGRISFFAGNWDASLDPRERPDAFFALYYIQRDSKDNISWIREIREIYRNNTDSSKFMYRFADGYYLVTGSGNDAGLYSGSGNAPLAYFTSIFNMSLIAPEANANGLNLITNAIYYFEIPVCAGEFALGSVAGHNGAYLLYLDIGANSSNPIPVSDTLQQNMPTAKISNDAVFTNLDYRLDGQTITVDDKNRHRSIITISYTVPSGANSDNFSIEVVYQGKYNNPNDCLDENTDVTNRSDYSSLVDGDGNNWCDGVYQIFIKNTTAKEFNLSVLLTDNDDDHTNIFPYAYEILVYQNGNYVASPNNESTSTDEGGSIGYNGTLRRWSRNYIVNIDGSVDIKK